MKTNNKNDFISKLMEFSDTELNDFIKKNGKPPKKIEMCHIIDNSKPRHSKII